MEILDIILISIGLAMDCFAVSIASGIILKRFQPNVALRMAFMFGLFQGVMPLGGYFAGYYFKSVIEEYDHWVALLILLFLGIKMIKEGLASQDEEDERAKTICPLLWSSILMLSLATSIDALATGIVFISFSWERLLLSLFIIGFTSFAFSIGGSYIGARFGKRFNFRIEILGGVILIGIGVKIFLSHLGYL